MSAPDDTTLEAIEARVKRRAPWILRQQRELEQYLPKQPARQYVSGETHRYLGRQYRLKIIENRPDVVKLARGYLYAYTAQPHSQAHIRRLVEEWYETQAKRVLPERVEAMTPRFAHLGIGQPTLVVKPLQARWGICTGSGIITLNVRLMHVPKQYIDYVVVHELAHLVEHNHGRRFYALLDKVMPDWRERRQTLNTFEHW